MEDSDYAYGKIAISSYMPAEFTDVPVWTSEESYETFLKEKREKELRVAEKRSRYAQPKLHKVIDLKNYGAARQIRFGHLMGGEMTGTLLWPSTRNVSIRIAIPISAA